MFNRPTRAHLHRAALAALCAFCLAAPAAQANLIQNGDFETGGFAPLWISAPGGLNDSVCKAGDPAGAATCIVHGGSYAMTFGKSGTPNSFTQTIPTVPGRSYTLSFWLANDNPDNRDTETFAAVWDGLPVLSLASPQASFPYARHIFVDLKATSTVTTLQFLARHDPSQWFLDDVVVDEQNIQVPTLGESGLLLLALLVSGLAFRRIRRTTS